MHKTIQQLVYIFVHQLVCIIVHNTHIHIHTHMHTQKFNNHACDNHSHTYMYTYTIRGTTVYALMCYVLCICRTHKHEHAHMYTQHKHAMGYQYYFTVSMEIAHIHSYCQFPLVTWALTQTDVPVEHQGNLCLMMQLGSSYSFQSSSNTLVLSTSYSCIHIYKYLCSHSTLLNMKWYIILDLW